jgi:uncharacterized protein YecE (DUF72 family)
MESSTPTIADPPRPAARARVGVAGWDYPDWHATVYPSGRGRIDRLAYIARFVDVVEINSSFYRPVAPRTAESWLRRTRDRGNFAFTAKSWRRLTHEGDPGGGLAAAAGLEGLAPLRDAGKLGALLVQFPQSFHFDAAARDRIARIGDVLHGWRPVVEVRHASWEADEAASLFERHEVGWCLVDQPRVGATTAAALRRVVGPVAYLRCHGRNAANWFRKDAGRDARYDYLYTSAQLEGLAAAAREMSGAAEELFVVQNNHFRGQALVNALQMKRLLQGNRPRAPEELVASYPELANEVTVERHRLF